MLELRSGARSSQWLGLAAGVWIQLAAGDIYGFPLYSPSIKSVLGYNQQQLALLGVANDMGDNIGIIPGFFCDKLHPIVLVAIGSVACFLGFGTLWLAVSQTLYLPYWVLWIALLVASHSSAWLGTVALVTNMKNFPLNGGSVAGIFKGYSALAAAIFTEIYNGVLSNSSTKLLLFLALGLPISCLALMFCIRSFTPATEDASTQQHGSFLFIQIVSALLAIHLLTTTILDDISPPNHIISYASVAIMVVLLLAPFAIPIKITLFPTEHDQITDEHESNRSEPLLLSSTENSRAFQEDDGDASDAITLLTEGEGTVNVKNNKRPRRGENFTFWEALKKADFWLLFMTYFVGVGCGVTVLNNLAQIGIAAGVTDATTLLSLFSFCNFVGRLGGGAASEYFLRVKMVPRTVWMAYAQLLMVATFLLYASFIKGTLYAATALLGICYGIQFSTMTPAASELFGLKNFGLIYSFILIGQPLGSLLFSGLLAGYVYDKEAERQRWSPLGTSSSCLGPTCFRFTFLVLAGASSFGFLSGLILTLRIRPVYQMLYSGGSFHLPSNPGH